MTTASNPEPDFAAAADEVDHLRAELQFFTARLKCMNECREQTGPETNCSLETPCEACQDLLMQMFERADP